MSSGLERLYPEGKWLCCICMEFIPIEDLYVDSDGQKWDNCVPCEPQVRRQHEHQ